MSNDDDFVAPKSKLKIKQSPAITKSPGVIKKEFEQKVEQIEQELKNNSKLLDENVKAFSSILNDKTLSKNKNDLQKQIEKEVLQNLKDITSVYDQDETLELNAGTSTLMSILLACFLKQRDRINELEYRLRILEAAREKEVAY